MLYCQMVELSDDWTLSKVSLSLSSRNTTSKPRPPTVQRLQPHRNLAGSREYCICATKKSDGAQIWAASSIHGLWKQD